jgi:hypothetical protein
MALPELVLHVQYLKKYTASMVSTQDESKKMVLEVIILHLLKMIVDRDFSDEVGRRELQLFLSKFKVVNAKELFWLILMLTKIAFR